MLHHMRSHDRADRLANGQVGITKRRRTAQQNRAGGKRPTGKKNNSTGAQGTRTAAVGFTAASAHQKMESVLAHSSNTASFAEQECSSFLDRESVVLPPLQVPRPVADRRGIEVVEDLLTPLTTCSSEDPSSSRASTPRGNLQAVSLNLKSVCSPVTSSELSPRSINVPLKHNPPSPVASPPVLTLPISFLMYQSGTAVKIESSILSDTESGSDMIDEALSILASNAPIPPDPSDFFP